MIRRLYRLWPDPRLLGRLWLLTAAQAVLQGLLLGLLVPLFDALLRPSPDFLAARPWLLLGAAGAVVYAVLTVVATPVGFAAAGSLAAQLRHRLMRHVSTLPLGWFTAVNKSRLARAVTADIGDAAHLSVTIGGPAITATLLPATITVVVAFVDWRIALLLLAVGLVSYVALQRAAWVAAEAEIALETAAAAVAGRAIELGQAQAVLRAARLGDGTPRMQAALDDHRDTYRAGMDRARRPFFAYTAVVATSFVAALALTTQSVLSHRIGVAEGVALLVLATRFLQPLGNLIDLVGALRAMTNKITRIEELLGTAPLPAPTRPISSIDSADVEFDGVGFGYPDSEVSALRDVSVRFPQGSTTALIGPSGSGKTTMTRLIARFFDVDDGQILVGGNDVRQIDPAILMAEIAIVFQDVYLFDDTIENNLRLAEPSASAGELAAVATAARLDEMIARLPEGWATRVGEGGAKLSGGERQRVSIARAMLKRSRIVLVDEAASALDPENERAVSAAIANLGRDPRRTVIVIAHRPATLSSADQVVSLADGRVVECGTPADILAASGAFSRLMNQYEHARHWQIGNA
ncbi:ABC transporter ATP-binding protein [Mycobacterium sp. C31M]